MNILTVKERAMSEFYRKEDVVQELAEYLMYDAQTEWAGTASEDIEDWIDLAEHILKDIPTIEPNLILPERMDRGECYEVGETIVVLNHDDYYDLLCKPTVDKDYLVSLIQEAVYDGEACKRLLDLVDRPQKDVPDTNVGEIDERSRR